jgi:hypothetical protein
MSNSSQARTKIVRRASRAALRRTRGAAEVRERWYTISFQKPEDADRECAQEGKSVRITFVFPLLSATAFGIASPELSVPRRGYPPSNHEKTPFNPQPPLAFLTFKTASEIANRFEGLT